MRVEPPRYARRPSQDFDNPVELSVLAGSRVSIEVVSASPRVDARERGRGHRCRLRARATGSWRSGLADKSASFALKASGDAEGSRFLSVVVLPDHPPAVRIHAPAKDLALPDGRARIAVEVEASDDVGLTAMRLTFTRASGGGESMKFAEGEVPLILQREDDLRWRGTAQWSLAGLDLADGDVLVYRAVARDVNPSGAPVQSDAYLIEIGKSGGDAYRRASRCRPRRRSTRSASRW